MARAATTADVFNAVAEPRRREILDLVARDELSVSELVERLEIPQPQVSKHLRVLRAVDVVRVRTDGRRRLYRANPEALRPIHEWVSGYAAAWEERFGELDEVLSELTREEQPDGGNDAQR
jgi:DNA-binding transcriptional ArsR family regulator